MLSIRLLGTPQLLRDGEPLAITRRKSRALLYYLAAHREPLTREHLLTFFWPDSERAAAQQVLRTTLHSLRQPLADALLTADESIALAPEVDVDARMFERVLSNADASTATLAAALDLYRGEFLADFSLPDSPEFENWIDTQREHYRRLFMRGLLHLSELHEAEGNLAAARDALERALAVDALQKDVLRAAMRLDYIAGERAAAVRRYEQFRQRLDDELAVPPMSETRAMYDAIITDSLAIPAPRTSAREKHTAASRESGTLPFTGRTAELHAIRDGIGARQVVLLEGEAGIG
ncbi:MAG: transcriptional regulator, partial [Chloroflexi bacterium]|nr:transcriptional regulator [Chloroflexota bacterium]